MSKKSIVLWVLFIVLLFASVSIVNAAPPELDEIDFWYQVHEVTEEGYTVYNATLSIPKNSSIPSSSMRGVSIVTGTQSEAIIDGLKVLNYKFIVLQPERAYISFWSNNQEKVVFKLYSTTLPQVRN